MTRVSDVPTLLRGVLLLVLLAPVAHASPPDSTRISLPPPEVRRWQVGVTRPDRLQHASLSAALACGAALATDEPYPAAVGTLALGVLKELSDARRDRFDWGDLAADAFGAVLGAWIARSASRP